MTVQLEIKPNECRSLPQWLFCTRVIQPDIGFTVKVNASFISAHRFIVWSSPQNPTLWVINFNPPHAIFNTAFNVGCKKM